MPIMESNGNFTLSSHIPISMDLDFHSFGFLTSDISLESSFSSGYLEDAIAGWNTQFKRQRTSFLNSSSTYSDETHSFSDNLFKKSTKIDSGTNEKHDVLSSSASSPIGSISNNSSHIHASLPSSCSKKIAYPFEVVKPRGGIEGDLTLKDINHKLLKRPTKPIKHPIAKCIDISSSGFKIMSRKQVLALTKIHTKGRGSITIIRTKD